MTIIVPPPEIRSIIDKLAAYVIKNGTGFETTILDKERHNPRFSFLLSSDPYHAYYQKRLQEYRDGGPSKPDEFQVPRADEQQMTLASSSRQSMAQMHAPPATNPEDFHFLLHFPPISALDYDVMKLTALYVARNGRGFFLNISQREARNAQFDFLKVNHSLHPIFLRLIDQYSRIILPSKELLRRLELDLNCRFKVLDRVWNRVYYTRYIRQKQLNEEQKAELERAAFESIDWHDFSMVETVDFGPADAAMDLPKPLEASTISKLTLVQRRDLWNGNVLPGVFVLPTSGAPEETSMDVEPTSGSTSLPGPKRTNTGDSIRHGYVPRAASMSTGLKIQVTLVTCPICNDKIPESDIAEHMRVESLDPKWKEQRDRHLAKHVETNYVFSGAEVSQNLASMNMARRELSSLAQEEMTRKMQEAHRASTAKAVIWDGRVEPSSIGVATKEAMQKAKPIYEAQMAELAATSESTQPSLEKPPIGPRHSTRREQTK